MSRETTGRKGWGFTLVELLVVIAIIVILLALLIGGLERALKAAERTRCGTNQRSIAQGCAAYALEYGRQFPDSKVGSGTTEPRNSLVLRVRVQSGDPAKLIGTGAELRNSIELVTGLGRLAASGRVGGTSTGGEAYHCPSLDTTSGAPVKAGMNEAVSADINRTNPEAHAGVSFWTLSDEHIAGGYYYRGLSYNNTHSNGAIRTNIAKATFPITSDLVTWGAGTGAELGKYGREYHHVTGWNVSFGDGHAEYILDPEGEFRANGNDPTANIINGYVEQNVAQGNHINGTTAAAVDERVFKWFGTGTTR